MSNPAIEIIDPAYMSMVSSTYTIEEITEILVQLLTRRGYTRTYATKIVNQYLDS